MTVSERPETLGRSSTEVETLKAEVAALKQQLCQAQRLAAIGTMAAMVAHEFNNILTPVINYAQLAQRNPALSEKALLRAAEGGKRATEICRALLGVSGRQADSASEFDVVELISQTLKAMARDPEKDRIELSLHLPQSLVIRGRRTELQQVILNLLLNARQAVLADNGLREIDITAWQEDQRLNISVRDSGVGIQAEDLGKIFQPFYTTQPVSGENGTGHGLGLAVCSEIIRSMGGDILVQSQPGQGSVFTLVVPCRIAEKTPDNAGRGKLA
ncbi:MAG: sensor histidine kinase [Phycisphaerae bacterium]